MRLTFGSLFAGIGGLDLGLERAGMVCKWQVEIDEHATKVLERHWPDVRRWRDIGDFIADAELTESSKQQRRRSVGGMGRKREPDATSGPESVDVICGGFPCQPVSVAGSQKGVADERWLWDAFREVVRIIRPRYVLAENVPGLLSAKDAMGRRGGLFGGILRDLAGLGYDAEWGVLPAAAFGAPHLRKRVFIVAHAASERSNARGTECEGQQRDVASIGSSEPVAHAEEKVLSKRPAKNESSRDKAQVCAWI